MTMRRCLILALAASSLFAAGQSPAQPAPSISDLIEELSQAKAAGDLPRQRAAYQNAATLLASDPTNQTMPGFFFQADLQRDLARTTYAIGDSDPCPGLYQGMAYLNQARAMLSRGDGADATEMLDNLDRRFADERHRMRCAHSGLPTEVGAPDSALIGHYYLSGVMETGSELLLKADGRFEWYVSYGSVDQKSKGRWGRTGKTVTLAPDLPSADTPLFRADEVLPWDEDVERLLRENERMQQVEIASARCPWNIAATTTLWSYDLENPKPATEVELAKAGAVRRAAEAARDEASRVTAKAAAASATSEDRAAANAAMNAWNSAQSDMAQVHHDANLPEPDIGAPAVPPECQLPDDTNYKPIPKSEWQRGVAVVVGDPARELRLSRVEVTFVFGDGHRETTKTRRGGFAFAPARKGTTVDQIVLALSEPVSRSATLVIKPLAEGIQAVIVDTQQIVEPAFRVMRLDVEGKNLIPQDMPRGRYSRN